MQYHQDGFRTGNPRIAEALDKSAEPVTHVDVLIVGCGPAGLTLAAQLSAFNDITTRIVDQKSGPLEVGQADGIACRSMEMFEAFGFARQVEEEAYWVNETSFWRPDDAGLIGRTERIQDVEDGLSEFPHTIKADGRWRLFVFADSDDVGAENGGLAAFSKHMLDDPNSSRNQLIANGLNVDQVIDIRAILQQDYRSLDCSTMPALFVPETGTLQLTDYEKVFCAMKGQGDFFDQRGINRQTGCIVIVRPDQYVAEILPMDATQRIVAFFDSVLIDIR